MGTARTRANNKWNAKAYDRINLTVPKGQKDVIKAHAEGQGESVNGFISRAIMEASEADNMHRAYQRGLLRQLEKMNDALAQNDRDGLQKVLLELIEDTKADIAD